MKIKNILSVNQFDKNNIEEIFGVAHEMKTKVLSGESIDLLKGKVLVNLFYEPSTRTSSSFAAAMFRLGGNVIPINDVTYSSAAKGENLKDTISTLKLYGDVIVLRHPIAGSADIAASVSGDIPIISGGDGTEEHPTQGLLDIFTIKEELGRIDGLNITMIGDLKHGRTVHSLAKLLSLYNVTLNYVAPSVLKMPSGIITEVMRHRVSQNENTEINGFLSESDCFYVTRVQKERFANLEDYERVKGLYCITPELMRFAKPDCIVMHPLPRLTEIDSSFDSDPRAAYFRQVENGLYIRMALLAMVLGKA